VLRNLPLPVVTSALTRIPGDSGIVVPSSPRGALPLAAPALPETLRFLLESGNLRVVRTRSGMQERFELWRVDPVR